MPVEKAQAPAELLELVSRFEEQLADYRAGKYNETQTRREFIDPLFCLLGWDVDNKQGWGENYKDVIHEDAIKVGGATKAPDYCFRIGGTRKYFVEAKKPSVSVKDDVAASYQLRRYAWSAKLPLGILTDFEEFAVYDCRKQPQKTDSSAASRILYVTFKDYEKRWNDIASTFAKESILKGAFDKYAESTKGKRGTAEVDDAFLLEIESWRESLARNIALRNQNLSQRELNFAVQRIIDRIIFLRICEDRNLEQYGQLRSLLNGVRTYPRLCELFDRADDRYNSGLFHFKQEKGRHESPDTLSRSLQIDDKTLKDIFKRLYYPDSPYEFSVLPADILGQVYERFLGKVIRLTPGHQAKVEEKPEVKKAGGVYYTPTYIVDYIVRHTVGKLVEGKTPKQVSELRILDPACGSGSFLIGAYQYLLDWHRDWYAANDPLKNAKGKNPAVYQLGGDWRLTPHERKRILLNNIYGVDIDAQAVEVTKLSLLLKVIEGGAQLSLSGERMLPDLGSNIKCGNSLIGPDFYQGRQLGLMDDEEAYRINVFDWNSDTEGFGKIMKAGGFDAVIGNPPYVRIQALKEWAPIEVEFYKTRYKSASKGNYDIYVVFVEKGLSLLNERGLLGYILPHKFFNAQYGEPLRSIIAQGQHLAEVVHFGDQQVFADATTYTCLLFLSGSALKSFSVYRPFSLEECTRETQSPSQSFTSSHLTPSEWAFPVGGCAAVFDKLGSVPLKLGDVAAIFVGLQTSADTVFLFKDATVASSDLTVVYSKELGKQVTIESALLKPVVRSGSIGRYCALATALVLFPYRVNGNRASLIPPDAMESGYPLAWEYLKANRKLLSEREHGKFASTGWYQLYPKNLDLWEQSKIMLPYMITRLSAYYDCCSTYFVNVTTGGFGVTIEHPQCSMLYATGLLNSRLLDMYLKVVSTNFHGGYYAANKQFIEKLPIRPIEFSDPADVARHDRMVAMVERMLDLNKRLAAANLEQERTVLKRQIEETDRQIDALVYELYGLTDEEIALVEKGQ